MATSPKIKLTYNPSSALTSAVLSTDTDQSPVYSPSYDSSQSYDRFVSANANEIDAAFNLTGGETFVGAFGAK